MPLSRHIDADSVIEQSREHPHAKYFGDHLGSTFLQSWARGDEDAQTVPKYQLPDVGIPSRSAYHLLHDVMNLDGNPTLNLASFVHTWMPEEATKLIMETINKNAVDLDEYPASQMIHNCCVSMIAHLWKAPKDTNAIGTATAGSSEAIMLGGLAMKKRWQEARKAAGKDYFHPNVVFGANAQVALEKFARYWDVEARLVPVHAQTDFVMHPPDALQYIDENTIGVMVIMGSTYTGHFEDVQLMNDLLDDLQKRTGLDVPIHVDAASGGFVAPFAYPNFKWAFDVPRVVSINTSGHKFGLVYPGLGWILWRDEKFLHKDLIFELHYLGSTEYSYTLNFSKPASPFVAQMYNFLTLGFDGYRNVAFKDLRNARVLSRALEKTYFKVLSNIHRPASGAEGLADEGDPESYQRGLPVVSFRLSDEFKEEYPHVQQVWVQNMLRAKGWIVPNYGAPPAEAKTEILRVVVRETLSADLIERLITDILETTEALMGTPLPPSRPSSDASTHRPTLSTSPSNHRNVTLPSPSKSSPSFVHSSGAGSLRATLSAAAHTLASFLSFLSPFQSLPTHLPHNALANLTNMTLWHLLPSHFLPGDDTSASYKSPRRTAGDAAMGDGTGVGPGTAHILDHAYGRPDQKNFADGSGGAERGQSTYAKQC